MKRFTPYLCLFAVLFPALVADAGAAAAETSGSAEAKAKLAEVRSRIATVTTRLVAQLKDRDALAARLRETDLLLTAKRRRLDELRIARVAAERRRVELRGEALRARDALDAQRAALAAQVRAAYMIGQQEELKLLLNQSDPAGAGRMLAWYGYFARDRTARIDEIRDQAGHIQELAAQIDDTTARLLVLQADTTEEMADLQRTRIERQAALAAMTNQVSTASDELARLQREAQAKEALVADLARVLQDFPIDSHQSFDSLRGKLPWPVPGRLSARYQAPRSNGVQIDAARGAKVRAPCFGRVVYADWLQGLGLLLIIGHSGDYMTLYGHAEVLYKSVGDSVAPGDVIAAMSDSAGASPQLYFEIRNGRKTVDPKVWLKTSP